MSDAVRVRNQRALKAASRLGGAAVLLAGTAAFLPALASGAPAAGARHAQRPPAFAWLRPGPAPPDWRQESLPSGNATLAVPPGWVDHIGDKGTATVVAPGRSGFLVGYINATPRQGAERARGFATFRTSHLSEEGNRRVRIIAAAEHLTLRGGSGTCVIDDYTSRIGAHRYREIACIGTGARATTVLIAAAPAAAWPQSGPLLERAVAYFNFS